MRPYPFPRSTELVISIRLTTGEVLAELTLGVRAPAVTLARMNPTAATSVGGAHDALPGNPIAGRIEAKPGDITLLLDGWTKRLLSKNRKPKSITQFRGVVERAVKDRAWITTSDITGPEILAWLDEQRAAGWKAATYNRNLCAFRSLTRYMTREGYFPADPLAGEEQAANDSPEGSRPSTTEEAHRLIETVIARQAIDGRCKANRALQFLMLFMAGMRAEEPGKLQWRNVDLVDGAIHWTPEINKNGRNQSVALHPVLVELLRKHAATVPIGPNDRVFPQAANRVTFRKDRERSGIAPMDARGRRWSCHSARKWFDTQLSDAGVPAAMVRLLMRHALEVGDRYYDATVEKQREALSRLPSVWPGGSGGRIVDNSRKTALDRKIEPPQLDGGERRWSDHGTTFVLADPTNIATEHDRRRSPTKVVLGHGGPILAAGSVFEAVWPQISGPFASADHQSGSVMPRGGLEPPTSGL